MSVYNSASFFYDEFRNLVENQDYQGLLTFFNDITNEQLAVLLRRQLNRLYDPILPLCRMGQSENCLELILEYGFRVSRTRFLNLLAWSKSLNSIFVPNLKMSALSTKEVNSEKFSEVAKSKEHSLMK